MAGVARVGDSISGMTTGDHHFHYEDNCWEEPIYDEFGNVIGYTTVCGDPIKVYDPAVPISGSISSGSSQVLIAGTQVAKIGSSTSESDAYDSGSGTVSGGSSRVLIRGVGVARSGDSVSPHNGTASISSGSVRVTA